MFLEIHYCKFSTVPACRLPRLPAGRRGRRARTINPSPQAVPSLYERENNPFHYSSFAKGGIRRTEDFWKERNPSPCKYSSYERGNRKTSPLARYSLCEREKKSLPPAEYSLYKRENIIFTFQSCRKIHY